MCVSHNDYVLRVIRITTTIRNKIDEISQFPQINQFRIGLYLIIIHKTVTNSLYTPRLRNPFEKHISVVHEYSTHRRGNVVALVLFIFAHNICKIFIKKIFRKVMYDLGLNGIGNTHTHRHHENITCGVQSVLVVCFYRENFAIYG